MIVSRIEVHCAICTKSFFRSYDDFIKLQYILFFVKYIIHAAWFETLSKSCMCVLLLNCFYLLHSLVLYIIHVMYKSIHKISMKTSKSYCFQVYFICDIFLQVQRQLMVNRCLKTAYKKMPQIEKLNIIIQQ